jgi:L-aspartate oxidase
MWRYASIARDGDGLRQAAAQLARWRADYRARPSRQAIELGNMLVVGQHMVRAALLREESRGAHYRADFPESRDAWRKRLSFRLTEPQPLQF